jgi:hypothetical protein
MWYKFSDDSDELVASAFRGEKQTKQAESREGRDIG